MKPPEVRVRLAGSDGVVREVTLIGFKRPPPEIWVQEVRGLEAARPFRLRTGDNVPTYAEAA